MRTSIFAVAVALAAVPAQAQQSTTPGQQQMQPNKQMEQEADKGIMTRNSGDSGFVGQQQKPGGATQAPGQLQQGSQTTGAGTGGGRNSETGSPR